MSLQAPAGSGVIFREDFISPASVSANGGIVAGSSVADGKYTGDGTAAKHVRYPSAPVIYGTKWFVRIRFRFTAAGSTAFLCGADNGASDRSWALGLDANNKPYAEIYPAGTDFTGATALVAGTDYDMVMTSDGTNFRCFVNGVQNGTQTAAQTVPRSSGALYVGMRGYNPFEAPAVCEIYGFEMGQGVSLSAAECLDLYQNDTLMEPKAENSLLWLPLRTSGKDGAGDMVTPDISPYRRTVKLGDGTTASKMPARLYPCGLSFDGGDFVNVGVPITSTDQPWSLGVYADFVPLAGSVGEILSNYKAAVIPCVIIQRNPNSGGVIIVYVFSSDGNFKSSTFLVGDPRRNGTVFVTSDGSLAAGGIGLYLNGVRQTPSAETLTGTLAAVAITEPMNIGKDSDDTNYLGAGNSIFAFRIYGHCLTQSQVLTEAAAIAKYIHA